MSASSSVLQSRLTGAAVAEDASTFVAVGTVSGSCNSIAALGSTALISDLPWECKENFGLQNLLKRHLQLLTCK